VSFGVAIISKAALSTTDVVKANISVVGNAREIWQLILRVDAQTCQSIPSAERENVRSLCRQKIYMGIRDLFKNHFLAIRCPEVWPVRSIKRGTWPGRWNSETRRLQQSQRVARRLVLGMTCGTRNQHWGVML